MARPLQLLACQLPKEARRHPGVMSDLRFPSTHNTYQTRPTTVRPNLTGITDSTARNPIQCRLELDHLSAEWGTAVLIV